MKGSPQTRGHSTTTTIAKRKKIKQIPHTYRPTYPSYPDPPPPSPSPYLPPDLRPIRYRYKLRREKTEKKKFYLYSSGGSSKASGSSSMPSVGVLHIAGGHSSGVTITNAQGRIFSQQKSSMEIRISTLSPALNWEIYPIRR
jgi:hypothetical protein